MEFDNIKDFYDLEKKSDASQKVQKKFQEMFLVELKEQGLKDDVISNALSCASLGSGISIYSWLNEMDSEQQSSNVDKLMANDLFKKNEQRNALKILCNLLAKNFCGESNSVIIEKIISNIHLFATNKNSKYVGDLENVFLKYFIDGMGLHVSPFDWNNESCDEAVKKNFCQLLKTALSNEKKTKRTEEQLRRIGIIQKWIVRTIGEEVSDKLPNKDNVSQEVIALNFKSQMGDKLKEIAEYLSLLEQQNKEKDLAIDQLSKRLEIEKQNSSQLLEAKKETEKSLSEEKQLAAQLSQNVEDLKVDIDKRDDVLTVFQADKKESESEKLKAIAAELKVYYTDLQEAKGMEMDAEIGNFLCDTLEAVFDTLKKNGIDVAV